MKKIYIGSRDYIAIDLDGELQSIAVLCLDHFFAASVATTCAGRRDSSFWVRTLGIGDE